MALSIAHQKVATFADQPGVEINRTEWNQTHAITGTLDVGSITATGTPNSSTYLRGDATWATPGGSGTVTTTGSPANGNLTKFSGASSITNGDLSGDVTTSGALVTAVAAIAGTTVSGVTGSGNVVFSNSPALITPALGTPASGVATNLTGTASGLTAGTVTTNANLTGNVTSVGNATTIASAVITPAMFATAGSNTIFGRSGGAGTPGFNSSTTTTAMLNVFGPDSGSGGVKGLAPATVAGDAVKFLRGDGTWATPGGSGTVTNTGGALTANAVVLGAGGSDTKVATGITTDGTSKQILGVAGTSVGSIDFKNATSGNINLAPANGALGTSNLVLPIASDTLIGKATTDTLTNKTFDTAGAGNSFSINGVAATDNTGTGKVVRDTSPTLVTPALGTPASGVMTNVTGTASGLTAGNVTTNANMTGDVTSVGNATIVKNNLKLAQVTGIIDGGGSAITNGTSTICVPAVFAGTITAYTITVDTGTCTLKTWKKATGTAIPTVSDSISTSGVSISSGTAIRSATVTDFTSTAVAANDLFIFNVTAISGATKISITLEITKT